LLPVRRRRARGTRFSPPSCSSIRDPEDDQAARQALDEWLRERPEAGIIVAAIDRLPDDTLDAEVKLSRLTGYQLIGLVQALLQQAIDWASETPGVELDPDFERLQRAKALLEGESAPELLQ